MKLDGQTILITGGSSGIGLELTARLIALGNVVIITGRDQAKLDATKRRHPAVHVIRSDVGRAEDARRLRDQVIKDFPNLSVLINNAGIMRRIDLNATGLDHESLTDEIEINLVGPIRLTQLFFQHLKSRPSAAIVNVSSVLAFAPFPISPVYSAAKAGLHAYTECLRVQLRDSNVRVIELQPPATETPLLNTEFDKRDLGGAAGMDPGGVADALIAGLRDDAREVRPGVGKAIKVISRIAPGFLLRQMSKTANGGGPN